MNVTELMAQIRTEMTGDLEKDIQHLQDVATDLHKEENSKELLEAVAEYAFSLMPDNARDKMVEMTFVNGKRMDQVYGEAVKLLESGDTDGSAALLSAISDKIAEKFEGGSVKWFSFRNPFEYHMYRYLYPDDTVFDRAPFDFAKYLAMYGYVLLEQRKALDAEKAIERAIKFNPVGADIRFELAEINKFAHNQERLLKVCQDTLPLCTTADRYARVLANMGFYCYVASDYDSAAVFYFESLRFEQSKAVELELQDVLHRMKTFGMKFAPPTHGKIIDTYEKYGLTPPPDSRMVNLALTLADSARQHGRIDLELMFLRTAYDMTHEAAFRERMETVAAELQEQQNTSGT